MLFTYGTGHGHSTFNRIHRSLLRAHTDTDCNILWLSETQFMIIIMCSFRAVLYLLAALIGFIFIHFAHERFLCLHFIANAFAEILWYSDHLLAVNKWTNVFMCVCGQCPCAVVHMYIVQAHSHIPRTPHTLSAAKEFISHGSLDEALFVLDTIFVCIIYRRI